METSGKASVLRCRKCRKCVVDASCLLSFNAGDEVAAECRVWHMDFDSLPSWILVSINQARWTTGRLCCQHCGARLGSFSFVGQARCSCGLDLTVHLCKSRLDLERRQPPPAAGGPPQRERRARARTTAAETFTPPPTATDREPRPTAEAPEAWPREVDPGFSDIGTVPSPPLPDSSRGPIKRAHRKARPLDYGSYVGAGIDPSGTFSDSQRAPSLGEEAQSGPALPQPCPTAAGQSELEERPETTPIQEVYAVRWRRISLTSSDEEGEETEEGAEQTAPLPLDRPVAAPVAPPRRSKRERNRLKSQRRKQRRRERWLQSQLHEHTQGLVGNVTSSEDEGVADREGFTCAVCLDVYFSPHECRPCGHVFCEPCLRTLARSRPTCTPCPLCRTLITHVLFQKELSHAIKTFFPKLYLSRRQNFQKAGCSRWPLPSTSKLFYLFGGLRRQRSPGGRRLFPHGGYGLGVLDMATSRGWRVDAHTLVYICSINWAIGLSVCLFLCYVLFSSY